MANIGFTGVSKTFGPSKPKSSFAKPAAKPHAAPVRHTTRTAASRPATPQMAGTHDAHAPGVTRGSQTNNPSAGTRAYMEAKKTVLTGHVGTQQAGPRIQAAPGLGAFGTGGFGLTHGAAGHLSHETCGRAECPSELPAHRRGPHHGMGACHGMTGTMATPTGVMGGEE